MPHDENMVHGSRSIPVLVDNSLNKALAIKYAIFSLFGLTGALVHLPSVAEFIGGTLASFTSVIICLSALHAGVGAWNSAKSVFWEKMEIYATIIFISFSTIWGVANVWLFFTGDLYRVTAVTLSLALLVMPIWRVRHLVKKNRKP